MKLRIIIITDHERIQKNITKISLAENSKFKIISKYQEESNKSGIIECKSS